MPSRLSLSGYRAKPGREPEILPHLRQELATLRARGHITDRPALICATPGREFLVVAEWATEVSVDDAHADAEVLEIWRRKEQLVDYLAPADLAGVDVPFASFDVVEEI